MFTKLNLKTNDRVKLVNLGPEHPDNRTPLNDRCGVVVGVASRHIIDYYIILLDDAFEFDNFIHKAVSLPESCLEVI